MSITQFLPPAPEGVPVRRHRLEDIHVSYTANETVQGVAVEIWDETVRQLPDGSFSETIDTVHDRIVRPATVTDLERLIPDRADLLAELSSREEALNFARALMTEVQGRAESAETERDGLRGTCATQAEALVSLRNELAQVKAQAEMEINTLRRKVEHLEDQLSASATWIDEARAIHLAATGESLEESVEAALKAAAAQPASE
jgi:septal ring factor EnvC (AmiA/AmiB activator)